MLSTSQNNAHLVFLDIFNGVADQLAPIAAVLRPNYNNFAAAVAAFPFSQLTDATKKALKAVTDNADLYLELGTLEAEASSSRSALNSIWMADPNGIRNRLFQMPSLLFLAQLHKLITSFKFLTAAQWLQLRQIPKLALRIS